MKLRISESTLISAKSAFCMISNSGSTIFGMETTEERLTVFSFSFSCWSLNNGIDFVRLFGKFQFFDKLVNKKYTYFFWITNNKKKRLMELKTFL